MPETHSAYFQVLHSMWPFDSPHPALQSPFQQLLFALLCDAALPAPEQLPASPPIKLVCISDTHQTRPSVPDGDVLLHAGDLTNGGTAKLIAGNHDGVLDAEYTGKPEHGRYLRHGDAASLRWGSVIYLQDTATVLAFPEREREVRIYGCPWTPSFGGWPFQYPAASGRDVWENTVPADTEVLLTHGPPKGHLDDNFGCLGLLGEIWRVRPRVVVFGHIHQSRGRRELDFADPATRLRDEWLLTGHSPRGVAMLGVLWALVVSTVTRLLRLLGVSGRREGVCTLVNAASVGPKVKDEAFTVVYL